MALVASARVPELDNGLIAARFEVNPRDGGEPSVRTRLYVYEAGKRLELPVCSQGGVYHVVDLKGAQFHAEEFYSYWVDANKQNLEENRVYSPFALPDSLQLVPVSARPQEDGRVVLDFESTKAGKLSAIWSLAPGAKTFDVTLRFEPAREGAFVLGCQLFDAKELGEIDHLLLPIMWQQKRFPAKPYTLFDHQTATPVSLMEYNQGGSPLSVALLAPPNAFDFVWPSKRREKFGFSIRNQAGQVQPLICGPFDQGAGTKPVVLSFQVLAARRDWYSAFRAIVDDVYQLRDYRRNVGVNLTEAIFNMIDLMMDDDKGGFWPEAKGFYQIESLNGATQAAPLTMLSLYYLTADRELYKRRTLPSIEYTLSREAVHFTPVPEKTGHYPHGSMKGPVANYRTTAYGGFWEMSQRLMPVFKAAAFDDGIKSTQGTTHAQSFEEWLERYRLTGNRVDLETAQRLADRYIAEHIETLPETDLGIRPFFLISFLPDWEGLLRLYEATGEKRYLDASVYGARLLTTGIWTFPRIPEGEVTIHPGNRFDGDIPNICMRKGPTEFRLGYDQNPKMPRQGVQKHPPEEHKVPAWQVSNIGLGFEQPSTVFHPLDPEKKARLVFQAVWAPAMLRLAKYTGDRTFETYARNAVVGRWANYPGYYATGQTDLPNDPRYPVVGPDISCIYYHHIPVHLGWSIDYLLSDAFLLSNGRVEFPAEVQNGYAYFDLKCYGHKPGRAFGEEGLWLWLKRGLVSVDNPQVNYIPMHRNGTLFVIFTNQSRTEERFIASFPGQSIKGAKLYNGEGISSAEVEGGRLQFSVPARAVFMIQLPASSIQPPDIHHEFAGGTDNDSFRTVRATDVITAKGTAIQVRPEFWSGYIWLEAGYKDVASATFYISKDGGAWQKFEDHDYPFEYSTEIMTTGDRLQWYVSGISGSGQPFKTEPQVMSGNRVSE